MIFNELKNLLYINDVDVYSWFKVFLAEEKVGDHTNMEALLKPSSLKANVAVDIREQTGEKYSADLKPVNQARDVTLHFLCHGDSKTDFLNNFQAFINFIKVGKNGTGWLNLKVAELDTIFKLFAQECSEYKQLTYISDDLVAARFSIKFREPQPAI